MNVAFRCDASLDIGAGHVMRCLTLASELRAHGAQCLFICREHPGNLIGLIREQGFDCTVLPPENVTAPQPASARALYAGWLGASIDRDAAQTIVSLEGKHWHWLVVDHYTLDSQWEQKLRASCKRLAVIDDLADRPHICDILLDQTLGRTQADYAAIVPPESTLLLGPQYALLRPEFAAARALRSDRKTSGLRDILITMGGVDKDNVTGRVLDALETSELPDDTRLTIVLGRASPWVAEITRQVASGRLDASVLVGADNMAELMAGSDLAIGAAGGTSWERCCLGMPTLMVILAENQHTIAHALQAAGAAEIMLLADLDTQLPALIARIRADSAWLPQTSAKAAEICDGRGAQKIRAVLMSGVTE